jgi:superfamily I DNA/RNA helicase
MNTRKHRKQHHREKTLYEKVPLLKTLNPQQNIAKEKMRQFLKSEDRFFLLSGGAGTGKTHTIGALISHLQADRERHYIACAAPTNKAVKVLKNSTQKWNNHNIDYGTIYQFLGLKMDYDEEGTKVLVEGKYSTIDKYDLVIIDESSMISSKLWKLLNNIVIQHQLKIICIGDNAQLNPVNEPESPVFSEISQMVELTEIMRTNQDNPVMNLIQSARQKVFDHGQPLSLINAFSEDQMNGVWILDHRKWLHQIVRAFKSPKYRENSDYVRAIAWTNREVNYLNDYIRNAIYEDADQPFVIGERLIATDSIFDSLEGEEIIINNSDEFEVIRVRQTVSEDGYNIWDLKVIDIGGKDHHLQIIDPSSETEFKTTLTKLSREAKAKQAAKQKNPWQDYWKHRNRYANVNYAYALTSHKSQGSTFNNVFVAQRDIFRNPNLIERYRSLYVSYSRTADRLFVNC